MSAQPHRLKAPTLVTTLIMFALSLPEATYGDLPVSGFIPPPLAQHHERMVDTAIPRNLPPLFLYGSNSLTPADDQGKAGTNCGSCWAFALMGMIEAEVKMRYGVGVDFSEQHVISCNELGSGCCGGGYSTLDYLETHGLIYEDGFPYTGGDPDGDRVCSDFEFEGPDTECSSPLPARADYYISDWWTIDGSDPDVLKAALVNDGPVFVWFRVYDDFENYNDMDAENPQFETLYPGGAYHYDGSADRDGDHAVLLIGYNDAERYWVLQNSWGENDGPFGNGTFRIGYDADTGLSGGAMCNVRRAETVQLVADNFHLVDEGQTIVINGYEFEIYDVDDNNPSIWVRDESGDTERIYENNCETYSEYGAGICLDWVDDNFTPPKAGIVELLYTSSGPIFTDLSAGGAPGDIATYIVHAPAGKQIDDHSNAYDIFGPGTLQGDPIGWDIDPIVYDGGSWAELRVQIPPAANPFNGVIYLQSEFDGENTEYYTRLELEVCRPPGQPAGLAFSPDGPHHHGQAVTLSWNIAAHATSYQVLHEGWPLGPATTGLSVPIEIADGEYRVQAINDCAVRGSAALVATTSPVPALTVTSPTGGDILPAGSQFPIAWTTTVAFEQIGLWYTTDGGSNWLMIADPIPNNGSYGWAVPNTPSSSCAVRAWNAEDHDVAATSQGLFTIDSSSLPGNYADSAPLFLDTNKIGFADSDVFHVVGADHEAAPRVTQLGRPVPNPFNPVVRIPFTLAATTRIDLSVYDMRGRHFARLASGQFSAGHYFRTWDGRGDSGNIAPAGVYLVRIAVDGLVQSKRITLVK